MREQRLLVRQHGAQIEDDAIVLDARDDRRIERAQPALGRDRATRRPSRSTATPSAIASPGALPPPTADEPLIIATRQPLAASVLGQRLRARLDLVGDRCSIRCTGIVSAARPAAYSDSVASSIANVILSARSARISGCVAQAIDQRLAAGDDAALRAAEQLVAAEAHQVDARGDRRLHRRLAGEIVDEAAAADVFDDRHVHRARGATRSPSAGRSVKPSMRKFDGCTRRNIAVAGDTDAV